MRVGGGDVAILDILLAAAVGAAAGLFASMGLGGGFVLLVYLILAGEGQLSSQGQNLVFFLPVIAVSIIFHIKHKLIDIKAALLCGFSGVISAAGGVLIASVMDAGILKKCFAVFIIAAGLKDLLTKRGQSNNSKT